MNAISSNSVFSQWRVICEDVEEYEMRGTICSSEKLTHTRRVCDFLMHTQSRSYVLRKCIAFTEEKIIQTHYVVITRKDL